MISKLTLTREFYFTPGKIYDLFFQQAPSLSLTITNNLELLLTWCLLWYFFMYQSYFIYKFTEELICWIKHAGKFSWFEIIYLGHLMYLAVWLKSINDLVQAPNGKKTCGQKTLIACSYVKSFAHIILSTRTFKCSAILFLHAHN